MPDPAYAKSPTVTPSQSNPQGYSSLSFNGQQDASAQPNTDTIASSNLTAKGTGNTPAASSITTAADADRGGQTLSDIINKLPPAIAQSVPGNSQKKSALPGVVGTVQIRKAFKLFANEQLIHNMSFRDTPVREVIAEIARRGNLNILIDKSVVGRITGELRDVTLNEAMDSVLAAAALQSRRMDNNTVIVATLQGMVQLGLNRPMARAFKLSYAHPYDVAMILHASIFNRGMIPDFTKTFERQNRTEDKDESANSRERKASGLEAQGNVDEGGRSTSAETGTSSDEEKNTQISRPDTQRTIRGSSRSQTQEGVGFNNAATDPGSQQIRSFQEINTDYIVDQNGGGAICIPDVKNRQILVVGTAEDVGIAEEAIRLLDRRPKQVHIQASLIELSNQGIRQLGATVALQGQGASANVLGQAGSPLIQFLPGLGSPASALSTEPNIPFANGNNVTPSNAASAFTGLVGTILPVASSIAGVNSVSTSQSAFNFLTLSKRAGGRANIATVPTGVNLNVNLLLQTNKAKVVANPSVVVVDNTETLITIASEVVHKVTSTVSLGVVTTNVELTKAGIFLNVLPKVTEDGFITMRLRPQVSTPLGPPQQFGSSTSPTVVTLLNVREIMTQEVRVKDGQTLVLGGLFTEQEAAQLSKVPYLAEAPVLGALFRNSLKGRNRSELMLLLTPKLVEEEPISLSETAPSPTM